MGNKAKWFIMGLLFLALCISSFNLDMKQERIEDLNADRDILRAEVQRKQRDLDTAHKEWKRQRDALEKQMLEQQNSFEKQCQARVDAAVNPHVEELPVATHKEGW
jgi:outer membrane murein-binding lipoprotein Lpp